MTGSLQIKNNKYYIVLNVYDKNGKRNPKWISTGLPVKGNKRRANQLLLEQLQHYEEQHEKHPEEHNKPVCDILFSDAVRRWLRSCASRVDTVTVQGYKILAEGHILPYFDALQIKLTDVDRHVLQTYLDEKFANGRKDGKGGLSPRTIRLHKNILFQTLTEAVRDGIIPNNPCEFVNLPQMQRYEAKCYNANQICALLEAVKDDPLYPVIKVTSVYGLRRSEVLGLKWDCVDFDACTLIIKHTVSKCTEIVAKDKTKNKASYRSFPLTPEIKMLLLGLKEREKQNRKLLKSGYTENDYIMKWDDGRPFKPDYVSHHFKALLKAHGFPVIRFHELRHSCASVLVNMGFTLKDVQEWLGHADIKTTADIYSHLDISRKRNIADKLTSSFAG